MDPTDGNPLGWITAALITASTGILWARQKFASSGASIANSRAEKDMLERYAIENEKLKERNERLWRERNEMGMQLAELKAAVEAQTRQLKMQDEQIAVQGRQIEAQNEQIGRLTREISALNGTLTGRRDDDRTRSTDR